MQQERRRLYGKIFDASGIAEAYDEPPQEKIIGM